jgi:hypothetical protein
MGTDLKSSTQSVLDDVICFFDAFIQFIAARV